MKWYPESSSFFDFLLFVRFLRLEASALLLSQRSALRWSRRLAENHCQWRP